MKNQSTSYAHGVGLLALGAAMALAFPACSSGGSGQPGTGGAGAAGTAGTGTGGSATGGTGAGGTGAGGGGSAGAGGGGGVTHPPTCPPDLACTESKAECVDGCAISCVQYQGQWVASLQECSAFGTCSVQQSTLGPVAWCQGDGLGDACDASYAAHCEGNVAFNCAFGKIEVAYCASDAQCWAEGEHAGCSPDPLACGKHNDGTTCKGGANSVPCCAGLTCDGSTCVSPAGSECQSAYECALGLACRTSAGRVPEIGEKGTCVEPKCVLPDASSSSYEHEPCGRMPNIPCCNDGTSCDQTTDTCCFPAGVVPLVANTVDATLCCNPIGTDANDQCQ